VKRMLLLLIASASLAGCGSLFQTKAAPPTMYLLSMAKPAPENAVALPVDLGVLKPSVRAGLDTDRIALLYPDRRLDYFANVRWSGPVDELVQELAVQEFHASGGVRNVNGDASAFASGYWLELEVADFQAEYSAAAANPPDIHVKLLARVGSTADRRVLARFEADATVAATDNRMSAIVDAYNHAADKALSVIVADCIDTLKAR
jgi:cholesterol transport system auxiliary component